MHHTINNSKVLTQSVNIPTCFSVATTIVSEFTLWKPFVLLCTCYSWLPLCQLLLEFLFIHSVFCLTTGSKPPPKRFLHIVRSRASSFKWEYSLLSLRSSSSLKIMIFACNIEYQAQPDIDQTACMAAWKKYRKTAFTSLPEDEHFDVRNMSKTL